MRAAEQCPEPAELQAAVLRVLEKIVGLITAEVHAFQENGQARFTALDKSLELAIGEKERSIGAVRQHEIDHRCQRD